MLFYILTFFFNLLAVFSSFTMVYTKSPVRSVFSLIITFAFVTVVFLQLNVHFATLVLLLVYLGAVIVMFLILVMFINIRIYKTSTLETFLFQFYIVFVLLLLCFFFYKSYFFFDFFVYYLKWFAIYDNVEIISSLCLYLFGVLNIEIFLVVFLLLISMISSMSIVFLEIQNLWIKKTIV